MSVIKSKEKMYTILKKSYNKKIVLHKKKYNLARRLYYIFIINIDTKCDVKFFVGKPKNLYYKYYSL